MENKKENIAVIAIIILIVAISAGMIGWLLAKKSQLSFKQQPSSLQDAKDKPVVNQQELPDLDSNQNMGNNVPNTPKTELNVKKESLPVTLKECGLVSKNMELVRTSDYNIFGESIFDTVVCGYLVKKVEPVPFVEDGSTQTNAYFRIIEFADEKFKESIASGADEGNSVNLVSKDGYDFDLGCLEKEKIVGGHGEEAFYINSDTESKILSSSENKPIVLILSFGIHGGMGCSCCSLAHKVRVVD